MSHLKITLPAVILLGGFLVCSTASYGKAEYMKSTKKACVYCHVDSKAKPKELTDAVVAAIPPGDDTRSQFRHLWLSWTQWGVSNPSKRRVQAQLNVSDQVTELNRTAAYDYAKTVFDLIQQAAASGVLRDAPVQYVGELVSAWAATTMDFMIGNPAKADAFCTFGFEAAWRALS